MVCDISEEDIQVLFRNAVNHIDTTMPRNNLNNSGRTSAPVHWMIEMRVSTDTYFVSPNGLAEKACVHSSSHVAWLGFLFLCVCHANQFITKGSF